MTTTADIGPVVVSVEDSSNSEQTFLRCVLTTSKVLTALILHHSDLLSLSLSFRTVIFFPPLLN
jgi:hypothetical protein